MSKLYLFAIGGSGSRVVRSLVMLLSAGVPFNASEIKLMIIDPDKAGGNLTETLNVLRAYQQVRADLAGQTRDFRNRFCAIPITPMFAGNFHVTGVDELSLGDANVEGAAKREKKLGIAFDEPAMGRENRALFQALYSNEERTTTMMNGALGRQHVGALGIVKLLDSDGFSTAFNDFVEGDRIFIISSIFGGTGASGFPILLRKLQQGVQPSMPNSRVVSNAEKGAITLFPYFHVEKNEKSAIADQTLIQKKVTTLEYYRDNLEGLTRLYYLTDKDVKPTYMNEQGGSGQKNPAHLIEFLAATAVIDFAQMSERIGDTQYMQYRMARVLTNDAIDFYDFATMTRNLTAKPMTQWLLMTKYIELDRDNQNTAWYQTEQLGRFLTSDNYTNGLRILMSNYKDWLIELQTNERHMKPFNLVTPDKEPFTFFTNIKTSKSNLEAFRTTLAKEVQAVARLGAERPLTFMELFWRATRAMVEGQSAPKIDF